MKLSHLLMASLLALTGCKSTLADDDLDQYVIQYHIEDNRYAVAVVEDHGISRSEARQYALQKAAATAKANGYQYFIIEEEGQVAVMSGGSPSPDSTAPKNLYYSMIQSGNFGRDRMEEGSYSAVQQKPAYQIQFSCYKEKPSRHAIDVNSYSS
jgi:hypothetical protein